MLLIFLIPFLFFYSVFLFHSYIPFLFVIPFQSTGFFGVVPLSMISQVQRFAAGRLTGTLKLWQCVALRNMDIWVRQRESDGAQHIFQGEAIAGAALAHDQGSQHD